MKFDRHIVVNLTTYIETNLKFCNQDGTEPADFNLNCIYLQDFIKTHSEYKIEDIKYAYYLIKHAGYIIEDSSKCSESPCIKGFTEKGILMLLSDLHK